MDIYNALLFMHLIGVTLWVGGMALMHLVIRPVATELLEPPLRLPFMAHVLGRFFNWVSLSIVLILLSGVGMMHVMMSWDLLPVAVYAMSGVGLIMMGIFGHLRFAPYLRLRRAVAASNWAIAAQQLAQIRRMVAFNLILGMLTIAIATIGRFLG